MTDARTKAEQIGDDLWLIDAHESGNRTRWLCSSTHVDLGAWC